MNARITLFCSIAATVLFIVSPIRLEAQQQLRVPAYRPVYLGFDLGTGLTVWQNATPTYFATTYPFTATPDTIHVRFNSGATPLFGFYGALSGDFYLDDHWSALSKFGYGERRGNWESTEDVPFDTNGVLASVPVTSEFTFMVRTIYLSGLLKYRLAENDGLYFGGGFAITALASNHYDLTQTIEDGPSDLGFRNFSSGQGIGARSYGIGGEQPVTNAVLDAQLLAGLPIFTTGRWTISSEVTLDYPLLSIWTSSKQSEYKSEGFGSGPVPITIIGVLALRYHYH
jgi:hypothetical protein